jgi:allantoinase
MAGARGGDPRRHATWLATRPPEAEVEAIRLMIALCRECRCRVHIVHLSAADALPDLKAARKEGLPISVETCPHYLCFAAEEVPDGATPFKCAPPIRGRTNREALWSALRDGEIDLIATDHSPCPPEMKRLDSGDFIAAWGGVASLELSLAATWTEASARGWTPADIARWMCQRPAVLAGLGHRKGRIAEGYDADFAVWNPDGEAIVDPARLHQRHRVTPYAGRRLRGVVESTYVGGLKVYERGEVPSSAMGRAALKASSPR